MMGEKASMVSNKLREYYTNVWRPPDQIFGMSYQDEEKDATINQQLPNRTSKYVGFSTRLNRKYLLNI